MSEENDEVVFHINNCYTSRTRLVRNEPNDMDYKPYENRNWKFPLKDFSAVNLLVKGPLGSGILLMAGAFLRAGYLVGCIGIVLIALLYIRSTHSLVRASQIMCISTHSPYLSYTETVVHVFKIGGFQKFSTFLKYFINFSLVLVLCSECSVCIVYMNKSVEKLVPYFFAPAGDSAWILYVKLVVFILLILVCLVPKMNHLVPFFMFSNIAMFIAFNIMLYYMFSEIKNVDIADRKMWTSFESLPHFFSTVMFSMEGITMIMPVENAMVTPRFLGCTGVFSMAITIIVILFCFIGFFGYYAYGDETKVLITANLPEVEWSAQIVQAAISISFFFTFMQLFCITKEVIFREIILKENNNWCSSPRSRNITKIITIFLLMCFIVSLAAVAGKYMATFFDLVGSIFLPILGILIPAVLNIVIYRKNWGKLNYILVEGLVLCMISLLFIVLGVLFGIKGL